MAMVIRWKDLGWQSMLHRMTAGTAATHVSAGVVGEEANLVHDESGLTMGEIALLQEFGSDDGHIPSRPFLRQTFNRISRKDIEYQMAQVSIKVMFRKIPRAVAMQEVGLWAVRKIKETIESGVKPDNAPYTIAQKGHGLTLRDSRALLEAIGYEIITGGYGED